MLSNRQEKIVKLLQKHKNGLTGEELSKYIGVSSRTIRTDIKNVILILERHGAEISSGTRFGYILEIKNQARFLDFLQETAASHIDSLDDRINYIIKRIIDNALKNKFFTQQDLADELYISLSTLKITLKEVAKKLEKYELELVTYKNNGMKISGNEMKIRYFISEYFSEIKEYSQNTTAELHDKIFKGIDLKLVQQIIFRVINAFEFHLTDIAVQNLLIHIAIAMKRTGQENYITYPLSQSKIMEKTTEFEIASSIFEEIYRETNVDVATSEIYYLTQHLMVSKKYMDVDDSAIERMNNTVKKIIAIINEKVNIDFSQDKTLLQWLSLHLKTAIPRMKFKMNIRNDVLDVIKSEYPLAFQIAVIASEFLEENENVVINENEIGYIAIHFGAALNRLDIKNDACIKRILIVCASGMGTTVLIKSRMEEYFEKRIVIVGTVPGYQLTADMLDDIDIVVTTVPINHINSDKIIQIKNLLNNEEIHCLEKRFFITDNSISTEIETFFRKDCFYNDMGFQTKEEIIEFLTEELKQKNLMNDLTKQSVFEREKTSATEIGNLVAIPHPIYSDSEISSIAVLLLKETIIWDEQPVQLVFLINIAKVQFKLWEPIFLKLFNYLVKNNGVKEILHEASYESFVKNLKKQFDKE
ncbi:BglG family transcription antiterminator [Pectinatus brassicae]|uniref:Lichenan operon transcriptional antiterminator n=1 Tax=Pectinatus brassicae TaxID=862415 RepID=A0A840UR90_9FIRM|nr:BglG family transcription antiterminator [Pectinatus brassicae]MBB5335513.1 lichenan operon transcriptional antiterminator [Pectinatus brassicae]